MEEEADAALRARLAEQLGQQQQVVVVHPAEAGDGRIVGRGEVRVDDRGRHPTTTRSKVGHSTSPCSSGQSVRFAKPW